MTLSYNELVPNCTKGAVTAKGGGEDSETQSLDTSPHKTTRYTTAYCTQLHM